MHKILKLWVLVSSILPLTSLAQEDSNPCDLEQVIQRAQIYNLRAYDPAALLKDYPRIASCALDQNSSYQHLFRLAIAFLQQKHPFDSAEYYRLKALAEKLENQEAIAGLDYARASVMADPKERHDKFIKILNELEVTSPFGQRVSANIHHQLGRACLLAGFEGNWEEHFEKAKFGFEQVKDDRMHIEMYWDFAECLKASRIDIANKSTIAKQWLDAAMVLAEGKDPFSIPAIHAAMSYVESDSEKKNSLAYDAADLCIQQASDGERTCIKCFRVVAQLIKAGNALPGSKAVQLYANKLHLLVDPNDHNQLSLFFQINAMIEHGKANCRTALIYANWAEDELERAPLKDTRLIGTLIGQKTKILSCIGDIKQVEENTASEYDFFANSTQDQFRQHAPNVFNNLALVYVENSKYQEAIDIFNTDSIPPMPDNNLTVVWAKGRAYHGVGQLDTATYYFERGLNMAAESEYRIALHSFLVQAQIDRNNLSEASKVARRGFGELDGIQLDQSEIEIADRLHNFNPALDKLMLAQACLYYEYYQQGRGGAYLDSCLAMLDITQEQLDFLLDCGLSSSSLQDRFSRLLNLRMEVLTSMDDEDQLSETIWRSVQIKQSRDLVNATVSNNYSGSKPLDSLNRSLNARIMSYQQGLSKGAQDNESIKELINEIKEVREHRTQVANKAIRADKSILNLDDGLQWARRNSMTILNYMVTAKHIYILELSSAGAKVHTASFDEDSISNMVDQYLNMLHSIDGPNDDQITVDLAKRILPEGLADHGDEHLLIIPDAFLNRIPFEGLIVNGQELGEIFNLGYSFSIAADIQRTEEAGNKDLLAVAPAYSNSNRSVASLGGRSKWLFDSSADILEMCFPLPGNDKSAEKAVSILGGTSLVNEHATEKAFTDQLGKGGIILLSAHGFNYDPDPSLSGIVFSNAFDTIAQDNLDRFHPTFFQNDGILHAFEIYDLSVNAELVILSACHSGTGTYQEGEGTMSLARAFMAAGANSVVMSLWQVDNESTIELVEYFLSNLDDGMRKSKALAEAKRKYKENNPNAPPYYYSGFVLVGSDMPIKDSGDLLIWICLGVVIVIGGSIFMAKNRAA